jgi:hypothetical protein
VATTRQVSRRPARSVAPLLQGSRDTAPWRHRAARGHRRPVPRAPRGAHPAGAFSSVGESARLITVRSLVRIQKGPRPRLAADGPKTVMPSPGQPARGCSSAGRAPALQAGGRRFEPAHLQGETSAAATAPRARPQNLHTTNSLRECRSPHAEGGLPPPAGTGDRFRTNAESETPCANARSRRPPGTAHGWRAPPCSVVEQ